MIDSSPSELVRTNQWVKEIVHVESKSNENLLLERLQSILGPVRDASIYELADSDKEESNERTAKQDLSSLTYGIVFKIEEKVFIEGVKIYEKVCADSTLMKIEALNSEATTNNTNEWVTLWKTQRPLGSINRPTVFVPNIQPILFITDTFKITISGSVDLIDAIGNRLAIEDDVGKESKPNLTSYSALARNLYSLIENRRFADVYFEVDGKVVPAHRNILISRSEYFRAMLSSDSSFSEATQKHTKPDSPIYLKQMTYSQLKNVLLYLYTGHIDTSLSPINMLDLMRLADRMNLTELVQLCLSQVNESLDKTNVIDVYVEASQPPNTAELDTVVLMCYDVVQTCFAQVSRSSAFCALSQPLMLRLIENVVPRLSRLLTTSEKIADASSPTAAVQHS